MAFVPSYVRYVFWTFFLFKTNADPQHCLRVFSKKTEIEIHEIDSNQYTPWVGNPNLEKFDTVPVPYFEIGTNANAAAEIYLFRIPTSAKSMNTTEKLNCGRNFESCRK